MTNPVYFILSSIVYPAFNKKLHQVAGAENLPVKGGYIIACNHVDWLDGFYITATTGKYRSVPTHFLTRSNNYWWTTIAVQIPDDRHAIIDRAVQRLRSGKVICNFPEGERNGTDRLLPGKTGTVRMAAEAGVSIVPAGITCDTGRNMGQSIQFLFSKKNQVKLSFGKPLNFSIPPAGITADWLTSETARLMRAIAPLAKKSYTTE